MGFFVAIAAALAAPIDAGMQGKAFLLGSAPGDGRLGEGHSGDEQLPYRPDWFHFVFMLASAYLAMVRRLGHAPSQCASRAAFRPPVKLSFELPVKLPVKLLVFRPNARRLSAWMRAV